MKKWWSLDKKKSHKYWSLVDQNWSYDNRRFFQCKIRGKIKAKHFRNMA